jgi:hypothetical protein
LLTQVCLPSDSIITVTILTVVILTAILTVAILAAGILTAGIPKATIYTVDIATAGIFMEEPRAAGISIPSAAASKASGELFTTLETAGLERETRWPRGMDGGQGSGNCGTRRPGSVTANY